MEVFGALAAVVSLSSLVAQAVGAVNQTHHPDEALSIASRVENMTLLIELLETTISSLDDAQLSDSERRFLIDLTNEGTALLQIATAYFNRPAKGSNRELISRRRPRYSSTIAQLNDNLDAFGRRAYIINSLLQLKILRTLDHDVNDQTESSYIQELESSRPYQTSFRDYNAVEVVNLESIIFPGTADPHEQLQGHQSDSDDWEQANDDSTEESEVIAEDHSSSTTWGRDARSISSSFLDDTEISGDEDSRKVIKDILFYDEAGQTHRLVCLLDTGATIDCISRTKAREIRFDTWLRKLKSTLHVPVGGNQTTGVKYVVKAAWQFVDGTAIYRQKLYVTDLDNLPYDIILSRRTIFQFEFLVSTMDCSPTAHTLDGIDALLPLGLPKLSREEVKKHEEEVRKKAASNEQQILEEDEKAKREAQAKKKEKQEARAKANAQAQQGGASS